MDTVDVIAANLIESSTATRPLDRPTIPDAYRGTVRIDARLCLACETCSRICASGGIETEDHGDSFRWKYDAGRCTLCALCVDYCPGTALTMGILPLPSYTRPGDVVEAHYISRPVCSECGSPIRTAVEVLLARTFGALDGHLAAWSSLCDRCRRRRTRRAEAERAEIVV